MAPRQYSRFTFAVAIKDSSGRLFLYNGEAFRYVERDDNRAHQVAEGDTLFSLAAQYFSELERPDGLWWVIADFQPEPIHDPTIRLKPGVELRIPSLRTVTEEIFSERRRRR